MCHLNLERREKFQKTRRCWRISPAVVTCAPRGCRGRCGFSNGPLIIIFHPMTTAPS
jgi:hypothetical protein